jgi:hypothetical protein
MSDPFRNFTTSLESPPEGGFAITPDDSADLPVVTRGLNAGSAGAVRVTMRDGSEITLTVAAGVIVPLRAARVWASGTTAGALVGLY